MCSATAPLLEQERIISRQRGVATCQKPGEKRNIRFRILGKKLLIGWSSDKSCKSSILRAAVNISQRPQRMAMANGTAPDLRPKNTVHGAGKSCQGNRTSVDQ